MLQLIKPQNRMTGKPNAEELSFKNCLINVFQNF